MTSLFPPRESLVSDILAGDGNIEKLFLPCTMGTLAEKYLMGGVVGSTRYCLSVTKRASLTVLLSSNSRPPTDEAVWVEDRPREEELEDDELAVDEADPGLVLFLNMYKKNFEQLAMLTIYFGKSEVDF